jgi:hypothetical protein
MTAKQIVPITILSITAKKETSKAQIKMSRLPINIGSIFYTIFYFRRAQRDSAEKTSKLRLDESTRRNNN